MGRRLSYWKFEVWNYNSEKSIVLVDSGEVIARTPFEAKYIATQISQTGDYKGRWNKTDKHLYLKFHYQKRNMSKEIENPYKYPHIRLYKEKK